VNALRSARIGGAQSGSYRGSKLRTVGRGSVGATASIDAHCGDPFNLVTMPAARPGVVLLLPIQAAA